MALTDEYQYGGNEYKEAKDKLMERILGEDQYLLKKKMNTIIIKNGIKQLTQK
ncbi:coagulase domain-containing protein [Staphylococcus aureus]